MDTPLSRRTADQVSLQLAHNQINIRQHVFTPLQDQLTSPDGHKRRQATAYLHTILLNLYQMEKQLECQDSVHALFLFFCRQCEDIDLCLEAVSIVDLLIQWYSTCAPTLSYMTNHFLALLENHKFFPARHNYSTRKRVYNIFNILLDSSSILTQPDIRLRIIEQAIALNDLEKDPRNLFSYFCLIEKMTIHYELTTDQVDDLFLILDNYFPVSFQKQPNDLYLLNSDDLALKLMSILSHPLFARPCQQVILENLQSSQEDNQLAALILFQTVLKKYSHLAEPYLLDVWHHIKNTLGDHQSEEAALVIQETLYHIINTHQSQSNIINSILDSVLEYCLSNDGHVAMLDRLCQSSPSVLQYILDQTINTFIKQSDPTDIVCQTKWISRLVILLNRPLHFITLPTRFLNNIKELLIFSDDIGLSALAIKATMSIISSYPMDSSYLHNLNQIIDQNLLHGCSLQLQQFGIDYFMTALHRASLPIEQSIMDHLDYIKNNKVFPEITQYLWKQLICFNDYGNQYVSIYDPTSQPAPEYFIMYVHKTDLFIPFLIHHHQSYLTLINNQSHPVFLNIIEACLLHRPSSPFDDPDLHPECMPSLQFFINSLSNSTTAIPKIITLHMVYLYSLCRNHSTNDLLLHQLHNNINNTLYITYFLSFMKLSCFAAHLNTQQKTILVDYLSQIQPSQPYQVTRHLVQLQPQSALLLINDFLLAHKNEVQLCQEYLNKVFSKQSTKCLQSILLSQLYTRLRDIHDPSLDQVLLLLAIDTPFQCLRPDLARVLPLLFHGLSSDDQLLFLSSARLLTKFLLTKQPPADLPDHAQPILLSLCSAHDRFHFTTMSDCLLFLNCLSLCSQVFLPLQIGPTAKRVVVVLKQYRGHPKRRVRKLASFALHRWLFL